MRYEADGLETRGETEMKHPASERLGKDSGDMLDQHFKEQFTPQAFLSGKIQEELDHYYAYDNFDQRFRHRQRINATMGGVLAMTGIRARRIVDLGCGVGVFSILCAEAGGEVVSCDMDGLLLKKLAGWSAKRDYAQRIDILQCDGTMTGLPADHFDVSICANVLAYLSHPHLIFNEMHRVLKPGGVGVVSEENLCSFRVACLAVAGHPIVRGLRGKEQAATIVWRRLVGFPFWRLMVMARRAGLEIVGLRSANVLPYLHGALIRRAANRSMALVSIWEMLNQSLGKTPLIRAFGSNVTCMFRKPQQTDFA